MKGIPNGTEGLRSDQVLNDISLSVSVQVFKGFPVTLTEIQKSVSVFLTVLKTDG